MKSSIRLDQSSGHIAWRSLTVVAIRAWLAAPHESTASGWRGVRCLRPDKYSQVPPTAVPTAMSLPVRGTLKQRVFPAGHIWTLISMAVLVVVWSPCTILYMYDPVTLRRGMQSSAAQCSAVEAGWFGFYFLSSCLCVPVSRVIRH